MLSSGDSYRADRGSATSSFKTPSRVDEHRRARYQCFGHVSGPQPLRSPNGCREEDLTTSREVPIQPNQVRTSVCDIALDDDR